MCDHFDMIAFQEQHFKPHMTNFSQLATSPVLVNTTLRFKRQSMKNYIILDSKNGNRIHIPISDFIKHAFLDTLNNDKHEDVNLTALIRVIQEKGKAKFRKPEIIMLHIEDKSIEMEVPALAKAALFSYTDSEIEDLFSDKMLTNELEAAVSSCLPKSLQPSKSSQRTLALKIADFVDIDLGYEMLASKSKLSIFISQNQHQLDLYEEYIEGYEFVSERIFEALVMFFELESQWEEHFNTAFELYLQLHQKGRDLVDSYLQVSLPNNYWNDRNDKPESSTISRLLQDLAFRQNRKDSFSFQFQKLHKIAIYM